MRAGRCIDERERNPATDMQTAWSDDDAFPEMKRDFDNVAGMVSAARHPVFRRKP
jgi:hypothetical protein